MLEVITIDFWNTIFNSTNGIERNKYRQRILINELDKYGRLIKQEEFEDAMKKSWEFFNGIWFKEKRTPTPLELVTFFWEYLKMEYNKGSIDVIIDGFANSTVKFPPTLNDGAYDAIKKLKRDFQLAIVSDTGMTSGKLLKTLLDKEKLLDDFDAFSFSDETGVSKPHTKAFETVLNKLNCKPENALHIGDIEKTDIVGAKEAGMYAIRYSGDKTGNMAQHNPNDTVGDADAKDWNEVVDIIYKINGTK